MIRISVKYCGGCNPVYDRVAAVTFLAEKLVAVVEFVDFTDSEVDFVLVVHGCDTECADLGDLKGKSLLKIVSFEEVEKILMTIINLGEGSEPYNMYQ